ncbi:kinase-like protein [Thelephora ganbajun]|uniref:Kinase-like protein n=1 Tax=Thelephora ganbajun TaxID=370292 RepID=A0ACB6Z6T3_THEGA|nr:kinase-like protein [Thelephora ganbajun]
MDCHGVFQDEGFVYFAMDHLRSDMHSLLIEKIHPRRMRKWIAQMALGIASLHDMGIIHRDIKPENVLVDRCDNIRIFDYGTAYIHNKPVRHGRKYSQELVGTRQYLAPEYLSGKTYGPTVDYWALGCTMFDLIAGDILFATDDVLWEYLEWDTAAEGVSYFRWRRPKLSQAEEDLLSGLLRKDPRTRYALDELRMHPYFFDSKGRNVFDEILREATAGIYG